MATGATAGARGRWPAAWPPPRWPPPRARPAARRRVRSPAEPFADDVAARDTGAAQAGQRGLGEPRRSADVDVAAGDVRDQGLQVLGRQQLVAAALAQDVVQLGPAPAGELVELVAEEDVVLARGAVDDG